MIARDLIEHFDPAAEPPVVPDDAAPPGVDMQPEIAAVPPVDTAANDPLDRAEFVRLRQENAAMKARLAALETPALEHWVELKRAAPSPGRSNYEWLRRRVKAQEVEAKKERGRWRVDENGPKLKACLRKRFGA